MQMASEKESGSKEAVIEQGMENVSMTCDGNSKSALRENIERKGKNAYYFANSNTPTGPTWDGKPNPKLLGKAKSSDDIKPTKTAFEYHKSNITSYAFSDEGVWVKLYIAMEEVGDKCKEEDITLDWTHSSFCLIVKNYKDEDQCLSFGKLTATISTRHSG